MHGLSLASPQDGGSNDLSYIQLRRGAGDAQIAATLCGYDTPGGNVGWSCTLQTVDSPTTASATYYRVFARVSGGGSQFRPVAGTGSIVAMEILP